MISRRFSYGYLVTTSPQSPVLPSAASSLRLDYRLRVPRLSWCDGRCVQGPGTYSPWHADPRLLAIPTSCRRVAACSPNWDVVSEFCSTSRSCFSLFNASGSMLICSSPKLIAAYHVFHRLSVPRHPPCALLRLTFVCPFPKKWLPPVLPSVENIRRMS